MTMAYLKSAADLSGAIGVTCGGRTPDAADPKFVAMMEHAHHRLENLLDSRFARAGYADSFEIPLRFTRKFETFRLTTGFVVVGSVVVFDPYGIPLNKNNYCVNHELGTVRVDRPCSGKYLISYNAGFRTNTATPPIYLDTPLFLRGMLDGAAVVWHRSVPTGIGGTLPDGVTPAEMLEPVNRYLAGEVYNRYQRPRATVLYPFHSEHGAPFAIDGN